MNLSPLIFPSCLLALLAFSTTPIAARAAEPRRDESRNFTPLVLLPAPAVTGCAEEYPGRSFLARHLLDQQVLTEYASNGKGTDTFVDFDFGEPVLLAGFRHVDRRDLATTSASELVFSDQRDFGTVLRTESIDHVNARGGTTVVVFRSPVTARFVRWKVTKLNVEGHRCVGGAGIRFFTAERGESLPRRDTITVRPLQAAVRAADGPRQPVDITVEHVYAEPMDVLVRVAALEPVPMRLEFGRQTARWSLPLVNAEETVSIAVEPAGETLPTGRPALFAQQLQRTPVRPWELIFLPHSHVDIGYTHEQSEVERIQWGHLRQALEIVHNTAAYPEGARFKWNSEVLWAVDSFLKQASEEERNALLNAAREGSLHLDGLYGNELTALCRPEELMQLTDCARRISREHGIVIDAAMISDVPGCTWGTVPALVHSGIKYLSIGPNHIHRIGRTLEEWGDRPFWWVSPSGQERLLCWMAGNAYSWFHDSRVGILKRDSSPEPFLEYVDALTRQRYPYDMVQIRYSIGGDNGPPDQELCEFVKAWNEKYVWPRMTISTTREMMHAFERRYGDGLPEVRGDFTPYWEDGAGSSAAETAMTRAASERLTQAETMWALCAPGNCPVDDFRSAWRDTLLYNEHTWGAHCSITQPDSPFTLSQWKTKQSFAHNADAASRRLLQQATGNGHEAGRTVDAVDVFNTTSWPRTELVILDEQMPVAGDKVTDAEHRVVASQRLERGQLAFVAADVPPFGARRFFFTPGQPHAVGTARAQGNVLANDSIRVELDPQTGAISSLRWKGAAEDLVEPSGGGLNAYQYVAGRDPSAPQPSRLAEIAAASSGGLVASLVATSKAPGARSLTTLVRVVDGCDRVDIENVLDKETVRSPESAHFGFPFRVPGGVMRLDIPWAVIRPDDDQLPGACKNYLTVGRWVDVSNEHCGVTWSTLDAPLIEVGAIRVDVPEPLSAEGWTRQLGPSQRFFSYVMNNYWETNYKASQEGPTVFRYAILPHAQYDQLAAMRFAIQQSQPLIVAPADTSRPPLGSRLRVDGDGVLVTSLKPSDDRGALLVRLWNAGQLPTKAVVIWSDPQPREVLISSPGEEKGTPVSGAIDVPAMGIVTLRAEFESQASGSSS